MKNILKKVVAVILKWQSCVVLKKYKPKIIAVTGNVGKTSTKDAIYSVFRPAFFVRRSEKSFNSDIGVPLTILGVPNAWNNPLRWLKNFVDGFELMFLKQTFPQWLVLEVGADRPGDIEDIARWVKPDVVVVTRFSNVPVHVEFFKSKEHLVEEKGYLVKALKHDGTLILNYDDADSMNFKKQAKSKVITYGFNPGADVLGSHSIITYKQGLPAGVSFKVNVAGNSIPVSLSGVMGLQHLYPILAAVSVGISQNLNMVDISQSLADHKAPAGRMNLIEGKNESMIIDDTYNSSPVALEEALRSLQEIKTAGRKIVCMGDMMELGKFTVDEHKKAGQMIASIADIFLTTGMRAHYANEAGIVSGMKKDSVLHFENSRMMGEHLAQVISKGDVVLIKGSQSVRMERTVEAVMSHPEHKKELLVRQEEEWQKR